VTALRRLLLGVLVAGAACTDERLITPPPATALAVSPDSASVLLGDSVFLQAVFRDQSGHAFIGAPTAWSTSNPAVATVSATGVAKGLALGRDTIIAASGALTATAVLDVVPRPAIGFSTDSVGFSATASGPNPAPDTIGVTNAGGGSLAGLAVGTIGYGPGASGWLTATLTRTTAPDTLVLAAQTGNLTAGTYSAIVPVTAVNATNSPHTLKVTFTLN
jgi:hypothetical protein